MGPIDYSGAFAQQSPAQALAGGYQLGAGIRDDFQQQVLIRQQAEIAKAERQRQGEVINALISKKDATAQDYANASLLLPTTMREQIKQSFEMKNTAQQDAHLRDAGQAMSAIIAGRPELAVRQLQQRADAMEASRANPAEIQAIRTNAQLVQAHPEFARTILGTTLASLPGGDKVLTAIGTAGTEQRAAEKAPAELLKTNAEAGIKTAEAGVAPQKFAAEVGNLTSQIAERSARLGLDQDKLTTETQIKLQEIRQKAGELPEPVIKNINEATGEAIAASQSAQKMNGLADQLSALDTGWGAAGTANEWVRKNLGMQNGLSQLRSEYNRIVTPAAMAAYKQVASGSTSDKDIDVAMTGVPKDTADTKLMAQFLRGTAKLQVYNSVLNNAKSEWFAANKHLGKINKDTEIDGVQVPSGTTFKQFTDDYVAKKVGQVQGAQTVNSLAQKYGGGASGSY
jgi:hypothetical protein